MKRPRVSYLGSFLLAAFASSLLAQAPLRINETHYRLRAGERIALQAPQETILFVRGAERISAPFAVSSDASGERVLLGVPLATEPGEYRVPIQVMRPGGETRSVMLQVTVEAHATVPSNSTAPPVILLNGWQPPSIASSCPISTDSTGTFGNLASYLSAPPNQVPTVYFFDNCTECPNCAIEQLGADLGTFIASLRYDTGAAVPQVDVIAHSMGGLIVRSYLSGKQTTPGAFTPPASTRIPQGRLPGPHRISVLIRLIIRWRHSFSARVCRPTR